MEKRYNVQVYDQDGVTPIRTIPSALIKNPPTFRSQLNGGFGELVLDLNLPFDDFDESTLVDYMNIVDVYAVDDVHPKGRRIYRGFVSRYEPYVDGNGEGVRVTVLGLVSLLSFSHYKSGSSFVVSHSGADPETIGRAIVDHFNTVYGGALISYSNDTTDPVGSAVNVTFTDQKWFDALKRTFELAGDGWWWHVDHDGLYWLKPKPSAPMHTFSIGGNVVSLRVTKDSEKVVNDVQVRRSGGSTSDYSDLASQATYGTGSPATGKRTKIVTDSSLGDLAAADQRGNKEVADEKDAKIATELVVSSDYDLESIRVGETCQIVNYKKGSTLFADNMQIAAVSYAPDRCTVELEQQSRHLGTELQAFVEAA
ncbi:MAG: hypothetical protein AB7O68_16805 [Pirellulales bacterium]